METIEDIVLRDGTRGMDILRAYLPENFITEAARAMLAKEKGNALIATGFYVSGAAETDGPPGAWALAKALSTLGYTPHIVTDSFCTGIFEDSGIPVIYAGMDLDREDCANLLSRLSPSFLVSIERCGYNTEGYQGNSLGENIDRWTAPLSLLFEEAQRRGYLTVGIGDGGNEIGMGKLKDMIREKLHLIPCRTSCDHLITATTSNWGAYGLCAALEKLSGAPCFVSSEEVGRFLALAADRGFINAGTHTPAFAVDGFPGNVGMKLIDDLHEAIKMQER